MVIVNYRIIEDSQLYDNWRFPNFDCNCARQIKWATIALEAAFGATIALEAAFGATSALEAALEKMFAHRKHTAMPVFVSS